MENHHLNMKDLKNTIQKQTKNRNKLKIGNCINFSLKLRILLN